MQDQADQARDIQSLQSYLLVGKIVNHHEPKIKWQLGTLERTPIIDQVHRIVTGDRIELGHMTIVLAHVKHASQVMVTLALVSTPHLGHLVMQMQTIRFGDLAAWDPNRFAVSSFKS